MKRKSKTKVLSRKPKGVVGAVMDAAIELGHAADTMQTSFEHIKKAQKKGSPAAKRAVRIIKRTGRMVASATRRTIKG